MNRTITKILSLFLAACLLLTPFTPALAGGEYAGKLIILHTNDVHGAIDKYAYVAGIKQDFEEQGAEVILADAGDYMQGANYVSISKGANAIALMNKAGYDVVTIGNHEFDYGYINLKQQLAKADFAVTCANVFKDDATLFDANYTYTASNGMKIGFFGLNTPESQTKANPTSVKGLTFKSGDALYETARQQVAALSDADIVVCLAHLGIDNQSAPNRSYDVYRKVDGLDFMIDGHSHTVMTGYSSGEKIQSTGISLANIGVIVIDKNQKKIVDNYLIPIDKNCPCDNSVKTTAEKIITEIQKEYGQVFAKSNVALNGEKAPGNRTMETNLGDLVADSMRSAILKRDETLKVPASNVVAITNGGSIRANIRKGNITKNDVNAAIPFINTLCVVYVTGAELLEVLEASTYITPNPAGGFPQVSGISFTVDATKAYDPKYETYPNSTYYGPKTIQRVTINKIGGKAFDANATYAVVTSDFCAAGGDTYYALSLAAEKYDTGLALDEMLIEYITDDLGGVIGSDYAKPQGRITIRANAKSFFAMISAWFQSLFASIAAFFAGLFK